VLKIVEDIRTTSNCHLFIVQEKRQNHFMSIIGWVIKINLSVRLIVILYFNLNQTYMSIKTYYYYYYYYYYSYHGIRYRIRLFKFKIQNLLNVDVMLFRLCIEAILRSKFELLNVSMKSG